MRSRKLLGLVAPEQVLHARAFELEDAVGVAGLEQVERRRVVEGQCLDVESLARVLRDEVEGVRMTVRLRRPRRSIFSRPMASMSPMANWVVISPLTDW